jgi:hypothetical protein
VEKDPHIVRLSPAAKNAPRGELPKLLSELESLAERELEQLINQLLDCADDKLFDMADRSNEVIFFHAMRQLRIKRQGVLNAFKQELKNTFTVNLTQQSSALSSSLESLSTEGFSLVKKDDLEERLAIETMVNKARAANGPALIHIEARLDTLCTGVTVNKDINPLDPKAICEAFRAATKQLDLDIECLLVVYKLFDRYVLGALHDVYDKINNDFIEKGILPDLHLAAPKKSKTTRGYRQSHVRRRDDDDLRDDEAFDRADIREEVFQTLQELLGARKGYIPTNEGYAASNRPLHTPVVQTEQLISALTHLQQDQGYFATELTNPEQLKAALGAQLPMTGGQVNGGTIGNANDNVIDIITLLFDVMLEDRNLHGDLKTVISRLQIPMLKVGLIDRSFFSNRNHPARQLLNELAHISIGWTPSNKSATDPLFEKITAIVDRVITEFKSDIGLFDELLDELEQFKESDARRAQIIEKRVREAEEGRARAESAKRMVNSEVARICQGRYIAEPVKQLLKEAWTNVLFLERLKPDNQESYQKALKVAEFLVWSVQPKTTEESRAKLKKIMPSLIKNLKLGMDKISFNTFRASQLLEELEDCHRQILALPLRSEPASRQSTEPSTSVSESSSTDADAKPSLVVEPVTQETLKELSLPVESSTDTEEAQNAEEIIELEEKDPVFEQVAQLQAGAWIEMDSHTDHKQRCKLAAYIASIDKYIFVNRTGVKIAELSKMQLALGIKQQAIRVLDDAALFDRALESVITNLRVMKEAENR